MTHVACTLVQATLMRVGTVRLMTGFNPGRRLEFIQPKHIEFITDRPRTAVSKIDKKALRQPFWAGQARQLG